MWSLRRLVKINGTAVADAAAKQMKAAMGEMALQSPPAMALAGNDRQGDRPSDADCCEEADGQKRATDSRLSIARSKP